jgi:hypothetical protein
VSRPVLGDASAKLNRGKLYTEALRADIAEAGQGEPYTIPLREELDEDTGALHIRVDRETVRPEQWGLLLGDALHNFRSALDNGWWEMASHHLRREPTEQEAKQIQFPIVKPGGQWDHGTAKKWVGATAAQYTRELQPDPRGYPPDTSHPLDDLRRLSNIDKHRNINPTVHILHTLRLVINPEGTDPDVMNGIKFTIHHFGGRAAKAGDDVLSTPPGFIERYPKVKFDTHQTGFVAIEGGNRSAVTTLNGIAEFVNAALAGFSWVLAGKKPPKLNLVKGPKTI